MKDYTQVQRDNAALTIREYAFGQMNMLRMLGDEDAANNLQEAINMAIAALLQGWVRTADRLPTEADGYVIGLGKGMYTKKLVPFVTWWSALNKKTAIYWMPLPKLPEV